MGRIKKFEKQKANQTNNICMAIALSLLAVTQEMNCITKVIMNYFEDTRKHGCIKKTTIKKIADNLTMEDLYTLYRYLDLHGNTMLSLSQKLEAEFKKRYSLNELAKELKQGTAQMTFEELAGNYAKEYDPLVFKFLWSCTEGEG